MRPLLLFLRPRARRRPPRPLAPSFPTSAGARSPSSTENAYPPLQFVDPKTGEAVGWEYDAMDEIAQAAELQPVYEQHRAGTR